MRSLSSLHKRCTHKRCTSYVVKNDCSLTGRKYTHSISIASGAEASAAVSCWRDVDFRAAEQRQMQLKLFYIPHLPCETNHEKCSSQGSSLLESLRNSACSSGRWEHSTHQRRDLDSALDCACKHLPPNALRLGGHKMDPELPDISRSTARSSRLLRL